MVRRRRRRRMPSRRRAHSLESECAAVERPCGSALTRTAIAVGGGGGDYPHAHRRDRRRRWTSRARVGEDRRWRFLPGGVIDGRRWEDEKIECCCFSRDGNKPFLFCTLVKGHNVVTVVLDISNWKRIGYKRLLEKHISTLSVSLDGKYLALGSHDGDLCVVDVKKMEVLHLSKKVHLGSPISSIEFCPTERVVISTSHKWGAEVTKLDVPTDWKGHLDTVRCEQFSAVPQPGRGHVWSQHCHAGIRMKQRSAFDRADEHLHACVD